MSAAPICPSCGVVMTQHVLITHDGTRIYRAVCDGCGDVVVHFAAQYPQPVQDALTCQPERHEPLNVLVA